MRPVIFGCAGSALTAEEKAFFSDVRPLGLILFARNCETPAQVSELVTEFRALAGTEAFVLIDQEGGRVQRLAPPHWRAYPEPALFGDLYARDAAGGLEAARIGARLIALDLADLGIDVNCVPLLDLRFPQTHAIIGRRAFGADPRVVADLGRATCEGALSAGVLPVVKHIPGHGRATADSHENLPLVDAPPAELAEMDFCPFAALSDMPIAMTAHILYTKLDPARPATTSKAIIEEVIRGRIGFDGLLLSDDVSMKALRGSIGERGEGLYAAGCDVALHCNGDFAEMTALAQVVPPANGQVQRRIERAGAMRKSAQAVLPGVRETLWARLSDLLSAVEGEGRSGVKES